MAGNASVIMRVSRHGVRGILSLLLLFAAAPFVVVAGMAAGGVAAFAQGAPVIRTIKVDGNRRVEPETIRSYLQISPGSRYDPFKVDESLKALFATGLFKDVRIGRSEDQLLVKVVENPIIHQVAFEGNKEMSDETLQKEVQLKGRAIFTRARVQADVQRILDVYRRGGRFATRVDPKIIEKEQNQVDLVFEIYEGPKTTVRNINFIGNDSFSDSQLRGVITTTETGLLSFLTPTNIYDPDRLNLDRELLRQHYLKNGFADVRVVAATADLDPNGQGFFISFTIVEGELYKFGEMEIETSVASLDPEAVRSKIDSKPGKIYDASKIEKSQEKITTEAATLGYAFARVRSRIDRDPVARLISVTYVIEEGPRVYIERIDIVGNTRTLDKVIRREFRLAEGDAYNRLLVDAARRRLTRLQYFKKVSVNAEPGSAPDRVILTVDVQEQATGELSVGGGWSSQQGLIADIGLSERNLLGKGQYVRLKLQGGFEDMNVNFSFTEPRFMGRNMSAGVNAFYLQSDRTDESGFSSRNGGGGFSFGVPLNDDWHARLSYSLSQEEIYNVQPGASQVVKASAGESIVSAVGFGIRYDSRNHPKNPSRGIYWDLSQDIAGLGGDVKYLRTNADLRGFYPVRKKVIAAARLQGGYVAGYGGQDVRLSDLFFKGSETIRGFDSSGIGPRDLMTGDALGGKVFAASSLELRFPLPGIPDKLGLSMATFLDAATLFDTGSLNGLAVTVGDDPTIRTSVGIGFIWESPLGPLRADFGFPLTSASYDEEKVFNFGAAARF